MKESRNLAYFTLKRETSKYNKYMKWHVQYYRHDNLFNYYSDYFKTEREAKYNIEKTISKGKEGFPIGDMVSFTEYQPLPL